MFFRNEYRPLCYGALVTEQTPSPALRSTTPKDIEQRAREILGGRPLLIVSNREPYEHVKDAVNKITCRKTIGGLVSALDPLMQALHGTWIAWGSGSGDRSAVDSNDVVMVPPRSPTYALTNVSLPQHQLCIEHAPAGGTSKRVVRKGNTLPAENRILP
jgi:hypothetical protein